MRTITTHHTNDANRAIKIEADERDELNGNASHAYDFRWKNEAGDHEFHQWVIFQRGPIKVSGVNGITNEALLAIVIDRLEGFQSSKFACAENGLALLACLEALAKLEARTKKREERGVEGTHEV